MLRRALLLSALTIAALGACHRNRGTEAPPPAAQPPPPPPQPCDLIGSWQAQPALPLGPQEIDISAGDKPGVYLVRAKNGANMGVATVGNSAAVPVDTNVTNQVYKCTVGADCVTMTCAFMGGAAPATFKRL